MINIGLAVICLLNGAVSGVNSRSGQIADTKVTLTVQATSATNALKQLAAASNTTLLTSPQTGPDIITFRFNQVPLIEAMKKIAEVVDGSWRQEGDAYRLVRTADQVRASEQAEFKRTVDKLKKSIEHKNDELKKLKPWDASQADIVAEKVQALIKSFNPKGDIQRWYQRSSQISSEGPISRAVDRACVLMDPSELAGLSSRYKTVWSTSPTATQRALPAAVVSVIQQFQADQALWLEAAHRRQLAAPQVGNATYWLGNFGDLKAADASNLSVALLSVQRWSPRRRSRLSFRFMTTRASKSHKPIKLWVTAFSTTQMLQRN